MKKSEFEHERIVFPSLCDDQGLLSVPAMFSICMDVASDHVDSLHLGYWDLLKKKQFWMVTKTRIHFYERPKMGEKVTIYTCIEKVKAVTYIRDYQIKRGDTVLVDAKSEWVVINTETKKFVPAKELLDENFEVSESVFNEAFEKLHPDIKAAQGIGEYIISSADIDVGHHMNNVMYVRAFESKFSTKQIDANKRNIIEIHYKEQSMEQETLHFSTEHLDGKFVSLITKDDGTLVAEIIVE